MPDEDDLGVGDEEETQELLKLDPKEWKVLYYSLVHLLLDLKLPILRNKINTLFLVSLTFVIKLLRSKSKLPVRLVLSLVYILIFLILYLLYRSQESSKTSP